MDGKTIRNKLVGSEDERAVSPVIGVILMVAITVILAAVIATLVMDFGDSTESPINAHVEGEVVNDGIDLEVTQQGDADGFIVRGDLGNVDVSSGGSISLSDTGTTAHLDWDSGVSGGETGTINIIAQDGDQEEQAGSIEYEVPSSPTTP